MVPTAQMRRDAAAERADALLECRRLADGNPSAVLPRLISRRETTPALGALRLWRIDQAMFGRGERACKKTAGQAGAWCGQAGRGGYLDLDWALGYHGRRLGAWLMAMSLREGVTLPGPDPYRFLDDHAGDRDRQAPQ